MSPQVGEVVYGRLMNAQAKVDELHSLLKQQTQLEQYERVSGLCAAVAGVITELIKLIEEDRRQVRR